MTINKIVTFDKYTWVARFFPTIISLIPYLFFSTYILII